jgi:DNA-binding response OmpR family regulator
MKKRLNGKKILVVDDNRDCRDIFTLVLRNKGYRVTVAKDGEEAVREIEDHLPDLILLDVMIPGRNGFDICEWVKRNPKISHIFIIMISAGGDQISRERGLRLGANDYLTKPIDPFNLIRSVQGVFKETPALAFIRRHFAN